MHRVNEIKVLIAEGSPIFRRGLEACFGMTMDIKACVHEGDGSDLLVSLESRAADVVLLDTVLAGVPGFTLVKQVKDQHPATTILLMTGTTDVGWLLRGIRAGASGVVSKMASLEEFHNAVRRVHTGRHYIAEPLAEKLVRYYQHNETESLEERLSPREFEVMQWLSRGCKLSEIARKLELSHQTVTTHRRHILEKTGLRTTAEIIRYGILNGLSGAEELSNLGE